MKDTLSYQLMDILNKFGIDHIFLVPGGGNMFLVDAAGRHPNIKTIATHHEQSAVIAAEAYSRIKNNFGVALVTTGPGGTNALTGIAGAWLDSIPLFIISGQVKIEDFNFENKLRQKGPQEINIVEMSKIITKKSILLKDTNNFETTVTDLIYTCKSDRPGPVLLDIPLNIQSEKISLNIINNKTQKIVKNQNKKLFTDILSNLSKAKKPLILLGHGVKNSKKEAVLKKFLIENNLPVSLTWPMTDFLEFDNLLNTGRPGVVAKRSANFIIQKSDFILALGSRLDRIVTAFNPENFGRNTKKFYVIDVDKNELLKLPKRFKKVNVNISEFVDFIISKNIKLKKNESWLKEIQYIKAKYEKNNVQKSEKNKLSSYEVVNFLSKSLPPNVKIVTGSSGLCIEVFYTHFKNKKNQKLFLTTGLGAMGYGLPALLGTCGASQKNEKVFLYESDGSFMMNMQELQTLKTYNYNATIFLMNNNGYASIRSTQNNYFNGRLVATSSTSGLEMPNFEKVCNAFNLKYFKVKNKNDLKNKLPKAIKTRSLTICEFFLKNDEILYPKCSVIQTKDNKLISAPIEDMTPLLNINELEKIMGNDLDPISYDLRK